MNNIYESGLGDELIDPENYNDEIKLYISEEAKLINELIDIYDSIVEVGCMYGRLLKNAVGKSKNYIGIDYSRTYIEKGNSLFSDLLSEKVQLINANCEEIHTIYQIKALKGDEKSVLIFPFNSFGNINNITEAIKSISECNLSFFIFTYQCNSDATNIRLEYYKKSGFKNAVAYDSDDSIHIKDELGLNSHAYKDTWLTHEFAKHNVNIYKKSFGAIGTYFTNSNIIIMDDLITQLQSLTNDEKIEFLEKEINKTIELLETHGFSKHEIDNIEQFAYSDIKKVFPENELVRKLIEYKFLRKLITSN